MNTRPFSNTSNDSRWVDEKELAVVVFSLLIVHVSTTLKHSLQQTASIRLNCAMYIEQFNIFNVILFVIKLYFS